MVNSMSMRVNMNEHDFLHLHSCLDMFITLKAFDCNISTFHSVSCSTKYYLRMWLHNKKQPAYIFIAVSLLYI